MPEPIYVVKGPEQLVVEDIIPTAGDYLVVESIQVIDPVALYGESGIGRLAIGYKVTFTNGSHTIYPTGSAIRVGE